MSNINREIEIKVFGKNKPKRVRNFSGSIGLAMSVLDEIASLSPEGFYLEYSLHRSRHGEYLVEIITNAGIRKRASSTKSFADAIVKLVSPVLDVVNELRLAGSKTKCRR